MEDKRVDEKLYRIRTKDGSRLNDKTSDDGFSSAIQFDENNKLKGPVEIQAVDRSEYVEERVVYVESEPPQRSFGQVLVEDAIAPVIRDTLRDVLNRALDAGFDALENWTTQTAVPFVTEKWNELIKKNKDSRLDRVNHNSPQGQMERSDMPPNGIATTSQTVKETVVHTPEEVSQILNNMKFASLYIAAGIRELSNTVIVSQEMSSEQCLEIQKKLKELSSGDVLKTIDFMLEERNRETLDTETVRLFEAFRQNDFIVNGERVPISSYLPDSKDEGEPPYESSSY